MQKNTETWVSVSRSETVCDCNARRARRKERGKKKPCSGCLNRSLQRKKKQSSTNVFNLVWKSWKPPWTAARCVYCLDGQLSAKLKRGPNSTARAHGTVCVGVRTQHHTHTDKLTEAMRPNRLQHVLSTCDGVAARNICNLTQRHH